MGAIASAGRWGVAVHAGLGAQDHVPANHHGVDARAPGQEHRAGQVKALGADNGALHPEDPGGALHAVERAQSGQQGTYVFMIDSAGTARPRQVQVSRTVDTLAVISSGLKEGEQVVVDGQSRLVAGSESSPWHLPTSRVRRILRA